MINERYIDERDIYVRIKTNKDITKEDKQRFNQVTKSLYLSEAGREKLSKKVIHNQERNKINNEL